MHPDTMYQLAKQKMQDDHAWAERERRARIARGEPSPDAVAFDRHTVYLSFTTRVRSLLGALRANGGPAHAGGA